MPFVLPQSSLGPVAVFVSASRGSTHGRAYLEAVYVLSRCYGILPIYKPAYTQSRNPASSFTSAPRPPCPSLSSSFILECTGGMDNACPVPGHLLTVEMLSGLARDGRSHDSTSHESSFIHSRIFARRDGFAKSPPRATCSREDRAAAPASFCRARRAKRRVYASPQTEKAPFPGSPADRPATLDRYRHRSSSRRARARDRHRQAPLR